MTSPEIWRHIVVHLTSTPLQVEGPPPPPPEGEVDEGTEPEKPPLIEFDPQATLLEQIAEDPRFVAIKKADIPEVTSETLNAKIEEIVAEELEKLKPPEEEGDGEAPAEGGEEEKVPKHVSRVVELPEDEGPKPSIDAIILLLGFEEELPQFLREETKIPLHAILNLNGTTIEDIEEEDGEEGAEKKISRKSRELDIPDVISQLTDLTKTASYTHWARNIRVETIGNIEARYPVPIPPPEEEGGGDGDEAAAGEGGNEEEKEPEKPMFELTKCLWEYVYDFATKWNDYQEWTSGARIKPVDPYEGKIEFAWYKRLMNSVPSSSHDVNTFLYCLVEQVERNLQPVSAEDQDGDDLLHLGRYFEEAMGNGYVLPLGDDEEGMEGNGGANGGAGNEAGNNDGLEPADNWAVDEAERNAPIVCHTDTITRKHFGKRLFGGMKQAEVCKKVSDHTRCPGYPLRLNFPRSMTEQERSAERNRIYPFMRELSSVDVEKQLLSNVLEEFLGKIGSPGNVSTRLFHEKITRNHLVLILNQALLEEPNLDFEYYPRHDMLLVALHRPVSAEGTSANHFWCHENKCKVAFNDIHHPHAAYYPQDKKAELLDLDSDEYAYPQVVEKVDVAKCSIWMQTKMRRGIVARESAFSRIYAKGVHVRFQNDTAWSELTSQFAANVIEMEVETEKVVAAAEDGGEATTEPLTEEEIEARKEEVKAMADATRKKLLREIPRAKLCIEEGNVQYSFTVPTQGSKVTAGRGEQWDPIAVKSLSPNVTLTLPTGQCVVAAPNLGRVSIFWPSELIQKALLTQTPGVECAGKAPPHFVAGSELDIEVERGILIDGTLIRKLISGRRETSYPDGTRAYRNPTVEDLESSLKSLHRDAPKDYFGHLGCLLETTREMQFSERSLRDGLPGHWIVTRASGEMIGRVFSPVSPAKQEEEDGGLGEEGGVDGDTPPAAEEPPAAADGEEGEDGEEKEPPPPPEPTLEELLAPWNVVRVGDLLEYDLGPCPMSQQVDPSTKEHCTTHQSGHLIIDSPDGAQKVCILRDGTVITRRQESEGDYNEGGNGGSTSRVIVEKQDVTPRIVSECSWNQESNTRSHTLIATMEFGVEVILRELVKGPNGEEEPICLCEVNAPKLRAQMYRGGLISFNCGYATDPTQTMEASLGGARVVRLEDEGKRTFELHASQEIIIWNQEKQVEGQEPLTKTPMTIKGPMASTQVNPRLFLIYGSGEAEELFTFPEVEEILKRAKAEGATVLRDQTLGPPMVGCLAHTIFLPHYEENKLDLMAPVTIPPIIRAKEQPHAGAHKSHIPRKQQFYSFRQFIEYRKLFSEAQNRFVEGRTAFSQWLNQHDEEKQRLQKLNEKKDKKSGGGGKENKKKAGGAGNQKGKKGAKQSEKERAEEEALKLLKAEPSLDPKFAISVREFNEQVLKFRCLEEKQLDAEQAMKISCDKYSPHACATRIQKHSRGNTSRKETVKVRQDIEDKKKAAEEEALRLKEEEERAKEEAEKPPTPERMIGSRYVRIQDAVPTFKYFESCNGIQFLQDIGGLDKTKPHVGVKQMAKIETERHHHAWCPPLVYEEEPEPELGAEVDENSLHPSPQNGGGHASPNSKIAGGGGNGGNVEVAGTPAGLEQGDTQLGVGLEHEEGAHVPYSPPGTPKGPYPTKKAKRFDVYGDYRKLTPPATAIKLAENQRFCEIEGPVDRRVRTASVANKKNATKAPSVEQVRKSGCHVLQGVGLTRAKGVVSVPEFAVGTPDWHLSSTQQGIGNPSQLAEVIPAICRFGPLRGGNVYRTKFILRNLDLCSTRFTAKFPKPPFGETPDNMKIIHSPHALAAGMATEIMVEVSALKNGKFETEIEVVTKAHVIKIPVMGRVLDAESYDQLDAESVAIHGRHIGHIGRGVKVVTDESYCIKMLGDSYDPPAEHESSLLYEDHSTEIESRKYVFSSR